MAERITIIINAQAEQAVKEFDAVSRGVMGAAEKVQQAGMRMSLGITLPLVAGATAALKAAADWDTAMVGVSKTVDAPIARIRQLGEEFVALSEAIPVAATQLANIGAQAGQLGIETESIMDFTRTVAALAVSTNLTAESAGNAMARMANIMGTSQGEFSRMGSAVVDLGNNLATTEAEIMEFGLRMAGAGKMAGMTESDIFAIGAAMSSVGVQAEAGGTAVQTAMIAMNTAVAAGASQSEYFARIAGMGAEEFVAMWKDKPIQAFTAFVEGLAKQGDQAAAVVTDLLGGNMRMIRAFLSLANAGDLLERSVRLSSNAWEENTALTTEATKFYERMAADFITVANKANNVAAELGMSLAPAAKTAMGGVGGLLDVARGAIAVFAAMPAPLRTTIILITGLAAATGPALLAVSGFMRAWAMITGLRAATVAIPLVTAAVTKLAIALPTVTVALRTLTSTTVIGAAITGITLLSLAFARAKAVALEAADSWRAALAGVKDSIAGLGSELVMERMIGAQQMLKSTEQQIARARASIENMEAERAAFRPLPDEKAIDTKRRYAELEQSIRDTKATLERLGDVQLIDLRAQIAVLTPEFQRLQTEELQTALALKDLEDQSDKTAVAFGSTIKPSAKMLGEVYVDLKKRLEDARKQLYALEVSQGAVATGTDVWKDLGESIGKARTEIQLTEGALARVTAELDKIAQARIGALDLIPRVIGNLRLGLQIPNLREAFGLPGAPTVPGKTDRETGKFTPTPLAPSASLAIADMLAAQRRAAEAEKFGLTPEQFTLLNRAARAAGMSLEGYAEALGIARTAQLDIKAITISGMGAIVAAFAGGMGNIKFTVINAMTQIMQSLSAKGGPLGGLFGGLGGPIFGAVGGILAAVMSRRNDRQKVEVDRYSPTALDQQKQIQPKEQAVQVILVDAQGNEIRRISSQLRRLTALDGVTRLPDYAPTGG